MVAGRRDPAQGREAPTDARRMRFVQFVQRQASVGHLSSGERDDRIERIFRARSIPELEAAVADLPGASVLSVDAAIAGEIRHKADRQENWFRRLVIYTVIVDAIGVVLWAVTGGGLIWILLLFMLSAVVFVYRVARRGKSHVVGGPRHRSR